MKNLTIEFKKLSKSANKKIVSIFNSKDNSIKVIKFHLGFNKHLIVTLFN